MLIIIKFNKLNKKTNKNQKNIMNVVKQDQIKIKTSKLSSHNVLIFLINFFLYILLILRRIFPQLVRKYLTILP